MKFKINFRGPFEEVTKIASPENYRVYIPGPELAIFDWYGP